MNDDRENLNQRDANTPEERVDRPDLTVEERMDTPPEAVDSRSVTPGSMRVFLLIASVVVIVVVFLVLSGVFDLGGESDQADDVDAPPLITATPDPS